MKGKMLGGETDKVMSALQNYFGMALRQNTESVNNLKKAIGAVLWHCCDLPPNVHHQFCPRTEKS